MSNNLTASTISPRNNTFDRRFLWKRWSLHFQVSGNQGRPSVVVLHSCGDGQLRMLHLHRSQLCDPGSSIQPVRPECRGPGGESGVPEPADPAGQGGYDHHDGPALLGAPLHCLLPAPGRGDRCILLVCPLLNPHPTNQLRDQSTTL